MSETIQTPPLIPKGLEEYIKFYDTMLNRITYSMAIPKEYFVPREFSGYNGSPQYWIDLKNELCKKNAIVWLEVGDE